MRGFVKTEMPSRRRRDRIIRDLIEHIEELNIKQSVRQAKRNHAGRQAWVIYAEDGDPEIYSTIDGSPQLVEPMFHSLANWPAGNEFNAFTMDKDMPDGSIGFVRSQGNDEMQSRCYGARLFGNTGHATLEPCP
jgi:hypothetical protein